jgi:hypothetical protein
MGHVKRMVCGVNPLVVRPRLLCGGVANTRTLVGAKLRLGYILNNRNFEFVSEEFLNLFILLIKGA